MGGAHVAVTLGLVSSSSGSVNSLTSAPTISGRKSKAHGLGDSFGPAAPTKSGRKSKAHVLGDSSGQAAAPSISRRKSKAHVLGDSSGQAAAPSISRRKSKAHVLGDSSGQAAAPSISGHKKAGLDSMIGNPFEQTTSTSTAAYSHNLGGLLGTSG
ncbi:hypothetical protein ACP275_13G081400 [Erythranthe tilingii]